MRTPGLLALGLVLTASVARAQGAPTPPAPDVAPPPPPPPPSTAPAPAPAPAPVPAPVAPVAQPGQPAPAYPPGTYVAPAYTYPPPPGMYVAAPPPPKREEDEPGYHLHDGFYLRMSLGAGWMRTRIESSVAGADDVVVKGAGAGIDILCGGTPTPGLVLGGGIFAVNASDPRVESGGKSTDLSGDASAAVIGPFVDGFFDSRGGFHLGGAIGFSSFNLQPDDADSDIDEEPYGGAGVALFTGYDAWVSPDWSMGGYVRFLAASGKRDVDVGGASVEEKATSVGFSILFSALYH